MATTPTYSPLAGIRVLEFTHAIMGPSAGLVLADLGAEVIKIERADGDPTRELKGFGTGYFTMYNRNKASLALDVKADAGKQIVQRLVETADVALENFAPGTMERLGFGYDDFAAINPHLIYCSLKGFMDGPYEKRAALDEVVQMMSGLAYMTGLPGQPLRAGASIVDIMGGTFAALGVLVALRERETSGRGTYVRNGLFETAAYIMGQHMAYAAIAGEPIPPMPARVSAWAVYHVFETGDDQSVFIGITSDKHWARFCEAFNRPDLLADESLATNSQRIAERDRLHPDLRRMFKTMTRDDIIARCERAEIPFAPIARPEDLFDDPQLNDGMGLLETRLPDETTAKLPRLPLLFGDQALDLRTQPPHIGEHSRAILHELGYDDDAIDEMVEAGVVGDRDQGMGNGE
jgi:crotonobetainyl-CoA:carnitine CoA-transferase CaiB-like acyl-CoA transferase